MASCENQNANYKKTNSIKRFHMNHNLENIFHLINIFATLLLFWRYSFFPFILQSLSHLYSLFISLFNNSFFAFFILNAIIIFIYILSNKNTNVAGNIPSNNYNKCFKITSPEFVKHLVVSSPEKELDSSEKMIVSNSEVGVSFPVFAETVMAVTETTTTTCCTKLRTKGEKVLEGKCYRRVQSESYGRRVVADEGRELKRVNTCVKKEAERSLCYVENLSKEEFNRTVEDFIAKHKRRQWEEQVLSPKTEYFALVP